MTLVLCELIGVVVRAQCQFSVIEIRSHSTKLLATLLETVFNIKTVLQQWRLQTEDVS
jgi:hypothetical protein